MEDVSYIRIDNLTELLGSGIDPKAVARKIYDVYLTQLFETYRIHADPHPVTYSLPPAYRIGTRAHPSIGRDSNPGISWLRSGDRFR